MQSNATRHILLLPLIWIVVLFGCSTHFLTSPTQPATIEDKHFIIVTISAGDTLASLAKTYLNDEKKAWQIAAYNQIDTLAAGKQVAVPLVGLNRGGLQRQGYQTVPVLLYDEVTDDPDRPEVVAIHTFERHMQFLTENGYIGISLDQLYAFMNLEDQIPPKAVVISFDTADPWVYDIAFPILSRQGLKAALFLPVQAIGRPGKLTWSQLAEMAAGGIDLGVYGNPPPDRKGDPENLLKAMENDIVQPTAAIRHHLKRTCRYYAYPSGETDDLTIALLRKNGYRAAFTRIQGTNPFFTDNYKIKRSLIDGQDDMDRFRQNLMIFHGLELE